MKAKPEFSSQNSESRIRGFGNRFFGVFAPLRDNGGSSFSLQSSVFSLQPAFLIMKIMKNLKK